MRAAYIGILTPGSTSRLRAETLRRLTPGWRWHWVDTDVPMQSSARVWRSAAFRMHTGAAVARINRFVREQVGEKPVDLAWIDKGVFLYRNTIAQIRAASRRLVHFTPDSAFHAGRSRHFEETIGEYDLLVTTKSFEVEDYEALVPADRLFVTTQGFDRTLHRPSKRAEGRSIDVIFVGLWEPDREQCIATLLDSGVTVHLAGHDWKSFVSDRARDHRLVFLGEELVGAAYPRALAASRVGLGLLSKRFPELHTTRTFEIPGCGAVLATERTADTMAFFDDDQALFFDDYADLARRLCALLSSGEGMAKLDSIALGGRRRILADGRDYGTILGSILAHPRLSV